jgi:hypothetical protein
MSRWQWGQIGLFSSLDLSTLHSTSFKLFPCRLIKVLLLEASPPCLVHWIAA